MAAELAKQGYLALAIDLYRGQVTAEPDQAKKLMSGSIKAPFGTSLSASHSREDLEATGRDEEKFWYVKLGHDFKMTDLGDSAISMDYAETQNFGANNREGTFYSLAAVQQIAKLGTEL